MVWSMKKLKKKNNSHSVLQAAALNIYLIYFYTSIRRRGLVSRIQRERCYGRWWVLTVSHCVITLYRIIVNESVGVFPFEEATPSVRQEKTNLPRATWVSWKLMLKLSGCGAVCIEVILVYILSTERTHKFSYLCKKILRHWESKRTI